MNRKFDFTLNGLNLFKVWILQYVTLAAFYAVLYFAIQPVVVLFPPSLSTLLIPLAITSVFAIAMLAIGFYLIKLVITHLSFEGTYISFSGSFKSFLGLVIGGWLLTIITLGIYMPWFIENTHRFFLKNSSYNNNQFDFKGKGGNLFSIILLTIIVPAFLISIITIAIGLDQQMELSSMQLIFQISFSVMYLICIYLTYKWFFNFGYKDYQIKWETSFFNAITKILLELLITGITLGIYAPFAALSLYSYFINRTVAKSYSKNIYFGFEVDRNKDFLFLWGQLLLTIITLGIYYPWALCKVGNNIIGRTYIKCK